MSIINFGDEVGKVFDQLTEQTSETSAVSDTAVSTEPGQQQATGDPNATITLDGPLSKAYTKALNLVYANEATNMMLPVAKAMAEDEDAMDQTDTQNDLYMYCCGTDISQKDLVDGTDKLRLALDSNKYKQVILAIEHDGGIGSKIGLLERFATLSGVKVCLNQRSSLEAIHVALKG